MDQVRVQFNMPAAKAERLKELMDELGFTTRTEYINYAFMLFEWAVQERKKGRVITSYDPATDEHKEVMIPAFERFEVNKPKSVNVGVLQQLVATIAAGLSPAPAEAAAPVGAAFATSPAFAAADQQSAFEAIGKLTAQLDEESLLAFQTAQTAMVADQIRQLSARVGEMQAEQANIRTAQSDIHSSVVDGVQVAQQLHSEVHDAMGLPPDETQ